MPGSGWLRKVDFYCDDTLVSAALIGDLRVSHIECTSSQRDTPPPAPDHRPPLHATLHAPVANSCVVVDLTRISTLCGRSVRRRAWKHTRGKYPSIFPFKKVLGRSPFKTCAGIGCEVVGLLTRFRAAHGESFVLKAEFPETWTITARAVRWST